MREEVIVLPPSADGRKASFGLSKTDEAAFNISRKWVAPEAKGAEKPAGTKVEEKREERDRMPGLVAADKVQTEALKGQERCTAPLQEVERSEHLRALNRQGTNVGASSSHHLRALNREGMNVCASSSHQTLKEASHDDPPPLQWGNLKRPRGSRGEPKTQEPSALPRETQRVQAATVSTPTANSSAVAHKGTSKPKDLVRKRDHPSSSEPTIGAGHADLEDGCKRVKTSRGSDSKDLKKRACVQGGRRSPAQAHQQEQPSHHSKTRTSPSKKMASPDRRAVSLNDAGHSKIDFSWPKFDIQLSRKEKEQDFLALKGGKFSQRPKRRPRAIEKAILYCTPGNWLAEVTAARYDVEEEKCTKRKPRGLKALASMDSDADRP